MNYETEEMREIIETRAKQSMEIANVMIRYAQAYQRKHSASNGLMVKALQMVVEHWR